MSTVIAEKYHTVSEAAEQLGLTVQRVRQLIKSGQLTADKAHHALWLIPDKSLRDFKKIKRVPGQHISARANHKR